MLVTIYVHFLGIFFVIVVVVVVVFHQKICVFIIFIYFFDKYPQQNINKSETGMGDKELSVEVYV